MFFSWQDDASVEGIGGTMQLFGRHGSTPGAAIGA